MSPWGGVTRGSAVLSPVCPGVLSHRSVIFRGLVLITAWSAWEVSPSAGGSVHGQSTWGVRRVGSGPCAQAPSCQVLGGQSGPGPALCLRRSDTGRTRSAIIYMVPASRAPRPGSRLPGGAQRTQPHRAVFAATPKVPQSEVNATDTGPRWLRDTRFGRGAASGSITRPGDWRVWWTAWPTGSRRRWPWAGSLAPQFAQRLERRPDLGREQRGLFPGGEVAAFVGRPMGQIEDNYFCENWPCSPRTYEILL